MRRPALLALLATGLLAAGLAGMPARAAVPGVDPGASDIRHDGADYHQGKALPFAADVAAVARAAAERAAADVTAQAHAPGDVRVWPALDDARGVVYLKAYTLRAVGDHIEVWVASGSDATSTGTDFPAGDCRNGVRTTITDDQVQLLVDAFDDRIHPIESAVFGEPAPRAGTDATLPGLVGLPAASFEGPGDRIVALVDNVRDASFYDTDNTQGLSYIAGFFFSIFTTLVDRNVMTIDAWDWVHRTGPAPPHEPAPGDRCANAPARPSLYEGVFAHEYQHLLHHDADVDETAWVNEGLADWAQTLTGYVDPSVPVTARDFDSHVQCFLGHLRDRTPANPDPREGGPENSLTVWGDQGNDEVLCDYGAAYTMMELLAGRYGPDFMGALHRDGRNGLDSLDALLRAADPRASARAVLHDWAAMVALDGVLDDGARFGGPRRAAPLQVPTLDATINWDAPDAYDAEGAPPNGSDYVRLRGADGAPLTASTITSLSFDGAGTLPPEPVGWVVDGAPPAGSEGGAALYSGAGDLLDRAIVRAARVPAADPTLTFTTAFDLEPTWDFAFVQLSTDGGATWTSLGNAETTTEHHPSAIATVQANVPGFTGRSGGGEAPAWITTSFDLEAWAGQDVLVSFRYVTDPAVTSPGWWVDDIAVGGVPLSDGTSLAGWRSPGQVRPTPVAGFTVQLVAYTDDHSAAWRTTLPLDENFNVALTGRAVRRLVGSHAQTVAAIVTYDEPTETLTEPARYVLRANGVTQPGGGAGTPALVPGPPR